MIIVKRAVTTNATVGLSNSANSLINSGLFFNGSTVDESQFNVKRIKPKKNIGLLINFNFLFNIPRTNPITINTEAITEEFTSANCAVIVVPMLAPRIIPKLLLKDIIPVLTKTTANTVTAELDCVIAVAKAPTNVPFTLFLTNLDINFLNFSEANS